MKKCLILDYGVGNISSVQSFFRENNYTVGFGNDVHDIEDAHLLILPGVGSFKTAAKHISDNNIAEAIQNRHEANKPILGICLGFQILTTRSFESPDSLGLGILSGITKRLPEFSRIGWGKLDFGNENNDLSEDFFYFNHSFGVHDVLKSDYRASSGASSYLAMVIVGNTVGVQFHPERSQKSGKRFLHWLEKEIWNFNV